MARFLLGAAQVFISSIDMNPAASAMLAPPRLPKAAKPTATGNRVSPNSQRHGVAKTSESLKSSKGLKKKKSKGKSISALLGKSTGLRKKYGGLQ